MTGRFDILGIDFTSSPSRKPITCINCTLDDSALRIRPSRSGLASRVSKLRSQSPVHGSLGSTFPSASPAASSRPSAGPHIGPNTFTMRASLAASDFVRR